MQEFLSKLKREFPFFFIVPSFVWQILFFYVPLAFMFFMSLIIICPERAVPIFSVCRYIPFLNHAYIYIIIKSVILAAVTGILCFLIGYPLASFLVFRAGRFKPIFIFLLILPFFTNFLLHVYSWFFVLDRSGILNNTLLYLRLIGEPLPFLNSIGAIMVLMVYCYLPFMVLGIYTALERFDTTLIEASEDLGASGFETWFHIIWPLSMSGIITGFFLVFVPSFGEFAIPGLMGGEKYLFVGSVIAQYALGGKTLAYGTAFTVTSFCCLVILMIIGYQLQKVIYAYFMGER